MYRSTGLGWRDECRDAADLGVWRGFDEESLLLLVLPFASPFVISTDLLMSMPEGLLVEVAKKVSWSSWSLRRESGGETREFAEI